ncbi:SusC/RagA family TonB-linked outer membrane protein [Larkinella humicola]|uniref:SusC/RagA family TonB-linked outer membrane protein n=1 Tax=Larkinella humicola TaxID=2607654 RepID=A0A5N1J8F1_9BACT|nr:SusC/RagA family TonB-linked outer membrane protein [Larkinella humicola]KAA9347956.1 SusC/RagA family TonB-linked outer membrane protein [Larkinella humicola]
MNSNSIIPRMLRHLCTVALLAGLCFSAAWADRPEIDLENVKISLVREEGSIQKIIGKITKITGYVFLYEDNLKTELEKRVKIENGNNLQSILASISQQSALEFKAVNKNIVIRKRSGQPSEPSEVKQGRKVSGRVTSSVDGASLPGVNVVLKGSQTGANTDGNGQYTIDVTGSNPVLVFSYIGFETQEIAVGSRSSVDLTLTESGVTLNEAVVTALGIKREKRSLGYAVPELKGNDLTNVTQENAMNSLAGRVPGVAINQTSGVGSSISVVIRGAKSLTGDNQPLFVIDGVPVANGLNNLRSMGDRNNVDYGNAISDLNPEDIESISVLKGPSAAALYGSRAGNGVILVTTKKGTKGKGVGITFSTSNVFERPYRYLDFHYKYGNGDRNNRLDESSAYWGGPALDAGINAVQWNSPVGADGNKVATPLVSYKDNMKNFLETGITSTNNIALAGSGDKTTYRISFNNMTNKGLIPNSDLFRNSLATAVAFDISKNFKLSTNLNFVRSKSNNRPSTNNRGANPLEAVYLYPHVDVRQLTNYWVPGSEGIQQRSVSSNGDNPYFLAYALNNGFVRDRVFGNIKLDWTISPELSAYARVSHDQFAENRETKIPWSYSRGRNGGYYLQDIARYETNADAMVTYRKKISDFDWSISGGGNVMKQNYRDSYMGGAILTIPNLYRISNIPNTALQFSNSTYEKAIYSLLGTASLGFKDQLYLDLTARNDWSSTLPAANRSYFYPSASLSWLANYTFNLPSEISLLKFRANIAQVGNDTDPYRLVPALGTGSWGSLITTNVSGTLLNPQLKPEIQTSTEFGVELNLFNNRLRFDGTYYNAENKNQILTVTTPTSSGFGSKLINAGALVSKGWEIVLGGTPIKSTNGWNLDLNVNFTRNRTTIKELAPGIDFYQLWDDNNGGAFSFVGEEIGNLYSRGFATVQDASSPYYRWPILTRNGEWTAVNDRDKRVKVGNFNPRFMMGMQASLSYKRFTLNASFDWRSGGNFQSYTYRYGESDWRSQRQLDNLIPGGTMSSTDLVNLLKSDPEKYIIPENGNFPRVGGHTQATGGMGFDSNGDGVLEYDGGFIPGVIQNADGTYTEHLGGTGTNIYPITDTYPWSFNQQITFDASFVKLREISLGYNIPKLFGLRNANISVYSRNIILWTAAKIGIDPERAFQADGGRFRQGIELQNVMPWTIPVGFKVGFSL